MSSDFWAGYLSGAIGIIIGNPLDLIKVRLQAGDPPGTTIGRSAVHFESTGSLVRGAAAPIIGYGALNALLFVSYNRSLIFLDPSVSDPINPFSTPLYKIWAAGAVGGLTSWVVSSPTELIKCRAQLKSNGVSSSWITAKEILKNKGLSGFYFGGSVTVLRDSVGYGFYFWSYELMKRYMTSENETSRQQALKVLLCGGLAGIVTWASVFPLDVIKTRMQTQDSFALTSRQVPKEQQHLMQTSVRQDQTLGAIDLTKKAYRAEGIQTFYRGLGVCSVRAFIVNAVQWAVYEWMMRALRPT